MTDLPRENVGLFPASNVEVKERHDKVGEFAESHER
jgi:hypothetical protein